MELKRVDHIGIAVKDLDEAVKFYETAIGLKAVGFETVEEQKVKVAFLPCGDSELELLESTEPDGPIARFIEKNGPGIQHIAIRVDDIDKALEELKSRGAEGEGRPPYRPDSPLRRWRRAHRVRPSQGHRRRAAGAHPADVMR